MDLYIRIKKLVVYYTKKEKVALSNRHIVAPCEPLSHEDRDWKLKQVCINC